jgi:hypothetical protein
MWKDYTVPGGTFRENLHNRPGKPHLPEAHTAAQFRYSNLKKTAEVNSHGDITINRVPKEGEIIVKTPQS